MIQEIIRRVSVSRVRVMVINHSSAAEQFHICYSGLADNVLSNGVLLGKLESLRNQLVVQLHEAGTRKIVDLSLIREAERLCKDIECAANEVTSY